MNKHNHRKQTNQVRQGEQTRLLVSEPGELMKFLIEKIPHKSRNNIKSLLAHGQVLVDEQVVTKYNHPLEAGQHVVIDGSRVREAAHIKGLTILYEDAEIIVIDKSAGLLSMASDKEKAQTAYHLLTDYVRKTNPRNRIFIVHRLDRDTSGVMMFAKNEAVKHKLQDEWKEIVVERVYVAVVEGRVVKREGTIKSWLKETKTRLMYSSFQAGDGLEAITHYKVQQLMPKYSLLELRLATGRKNQIRVHMKDIGHCVIGDKKYGSKVNPIGRLGLHAHILTFNHPISGELMCFKSAVPENFLRLFAGN